MSAKKRWSQLEAKRTGVLKRARDASELTIPSLIPPEGANQNTELPEPYQSLGARGVNNLTSKTLMAAFPVNNAFFRLEIEASVREQLGSAATQVDDSLRAMENRAMKRLETTVRAALYDTVLHLIVSGNSVLYVPKKGGVRMFRLPQFVILRDAEGLMIELVIKEEIDASTLSEEIKELAELSSEDSSLKVVDVYTHLRLEDGGKRYYWHQELNDKILPNTKGQSSIEKCPYLALRWKAVPGEDYGRGHVEEYMGDLRSLDALYADILKLASAAVKIIHFVHPNATTDIDEVANAESGDFVVGDINDVDTLSLDKFPDFRVVKEVVDGLELRLSHGFLLRSGTVRDAERVTAEEIRALAQELEDVLGGVYTVLAVELQLPLVKRLLEQMRAEGDLPTFPMIDGKDIIEPTVVAGFEALGRTHELNRLQAHFVDVQNILGEEAVEYFDETAVITKLASMRNVDITDLLKSADTLAAKQQQQTLMSLADKAAGPVSGALAQGFAQQQTSEG